MSNKGFFTFYGVYLQVVLTAVAIAITIDRDFFVRNWLSSVIGISSVLVIPFIALAVAHWQGDFAKWLRLFTFAFFRVEVFAGLGIWILVP